MEEQHRSTPKHTSASPMLRMRKQMRLMMTGSAILAVVGIGGIGWTIFSMQQDGTTNNSNYMADDTVFGAYGVRGQMSGDAPSDLDENGGSMRTMNASYSQYLLSDGSIDSSAIQDVMDQLVYMKTRFIERLESQVESAVDDGDITESQADQLLDAFTSAWEEANDEN